MSRRACMATAASVAVKAARRQRLPAGQCRWPAASGPDFRELSQRQDAELQGPFECGTAGDNVAIERCDHCLTGLGVTADAAAHSFDLEMSVLCGGAIREANQIVPPVQEYVGQNARAGMETKVRFGVAELCDYSAALCIPTLFSEDNY